MCVVRGRKVEKLDDYTMIHRLQTHTLDALTGIIGQTNILQISCTRDDLGDRRRPLHSDLIALQVQFRHSSVAAN